MKLLGRIRVGQKDGQAVDHQRPRQPVDDRGQHLVQIGFRVQIAAKLGQRLPVVITFAIEKLVQVILHPVLKGIEQQRSDGDGYHQSQRPGAGEVLVEQHRGHAYGGKVRSRNRAGCDGVGHAALEDQVHIHQPIAEDGVAEGQRQKHQRQHRNLHPQAGHAAGKIRDDVEQRERRNRQNRSARHPLHLLPQDRRLGMTIAVPQGEGRGHKIGRQVNRFQPIQVPAQDFAGLEQGNHADVYGQQKCPRQVHQGNQPAAAGQHLLALREGQRKMQEQRRLQQPGDYVGPVHNPVEVVELAGVVERIKDERDQAENVEVRALGRSPASQQNVQANAQVDQRNQPQSAVERPVGGSQNQRRFYRHTLPD